MLLGVCTDDTLGVAAGPKNQLKLLFAGIDKLVNKVVNPTHIVEFLILDKNFPRSVVHCLKEAQASLYDISGTSSDNGFSNPAEKKLSKLLSEVEFTEIDDILNTGLHQYLDNFQIKNNEVGETIFNTYFDLKPVS